MIDCKLSFECPKKWEELESTDTNGVRFCDGCNQKVYWVNDLAEYNRQAEAGRCIAFESPFYATLGMPDGVLKEYSLLLIDEKLNASQLARIKKERMTNQSYSDIKSIYQKGNLVLQGVSESSAVKEKRFYDSIGVTVKIVES